MTNKYLIFGATGSIGSSLAKMFKQSDFDIHLVARQEDLLSQLANELDCSFTAADVLEDNFIEKVPGPHP